MKIELTTESSQSHYGIPVARIEGVDYGPADFVPSVGKTAAELVCEAVSAFKLERGDAVAFCSQ